MGVAGDCLWELTLRELEWMARGRRWAAWERTADLAHRMTRLWAADLPKDFSPADCLPEDLQSELVDE